MERPNAWKSYGKKQLNEVERKPGITAALSVTAKPSANARRRSFPGWRRQGTGIWSRR